MNIVDILKKTGGIFTNSHFVYTSGKHGNLYLNKDAIYPHTEAASAVGKLFAAKHKDKDIDTVVGPALGGIILSQWTAFHLSKLKGREIYGVYTEKGPDKSMIFTRGYDKFVTGKKILVIEDITNTGGSVRKVVDVVKAAGGNVVAVSVMINRDPKNVTSEVVGGPFDALSEFPAEAWEEKDCPMCKKNIPINAAVGHGKKYLEAKKSNQ